MEPFVIAENDAGQRLDKFILKLAPLLPQSVLYKAIRKKDVKLNGAKTHQSTILQKGDTVQLYLHTKFFTPPNLDFLTAPADLTVVYEDDHILVIDKPAGLLMHGGTDSTTDTLIARTLHYLYNSGSYRPSKEQSFTPAFCNRIDRNTRGLILAAKNFKTLQLLNQKIKNRELTRKYLCLVRGVPLKKSATLTGYFTKDGAENLVTITENPQKGSQLVETSYKLLEDRGEQSLLEVELHTGRSHQIRAHLALIGHPLVGDRKYGDTGEMRGGKRGQQLVAYYLGFDFTTPSDHLDYLKGTHIQLDPTDLL